MDWSAPINIYCERLDPGFWAEPVNALTNIAFLVAAAWAFSALRRERRRDPALLALVALVAAIGIGSFLFHTFANRWSLIADVLPITVFIYAYYGLAMRRFFGLGWIATAIAMIAFAGFSAAVEPLLAPLIGGSAAYAPALAALFGIGAALRVSGRPAGSYLLAAGAVFAASLAFRTFDQPLCAATGVGTHFLWHLLNALTLGVLLAAALRAGRRGLRQPSQGGRLGPDDPAGAGGQ